jgi:hypothetical protein
VENSLRGRLPHQRRAVAALSRPSRCRGRGGSTPRLSWRRRFSPAQDLRGLGISRPPPPSDASHRSDVSPLSDSRRPKTRLYDSVVQERQPLECALECAFEIPIPQSISGQEQSREPIGKCDGISELKDGRVQFKESCNPASAGLPFRSLIYILPHHF